MKYQDQREENYYSGKDFLFLGDYHIREYGYNESPGKEQRVVTYSVFKLDNLRGYSFKLQFKTTLYNSGKIVKTPFVVIATNEEIEISKMIEIICKTIKKCKKMRNNRR